jgi:hypothetical protein
VHEENAVQLHPLLEEEPREYVVSNCPQTSAWRMVNVLKNCNTGLDHRIIFSLYVKKDVHVFINVTCTDHVK